MVTNKTIKAPVGLGSTANLFGVKTDTTTVCQAKGINKWAKYKPIALTSMGRTDTPASLDEATRKAANYGLTYKMAYAASKAGLPDAIAQVCGDNGAWAYVKPVTGTDRTRLDDFANPNGWKTLVGYDHYSEGPCVNFDLGNTEYKTNVTASTDLSFTTRSSSANPGQLHLNELAYYDKLKTCYLCLAFKYGAEWYYIFSASTVASVDWADSDPGMTLPIITTSLFEPWTKIPKNVKTSFTGRLCLIDLATAFDGNVPDTYPGKCVSQSSLAAHAYYVYSLPFADMSLTQQQFYVTNPAAATELAYNATWEEVTGGIQITVTVANHTTTAATFDRLFVYFMTETVVDDSSLWDGSYAKVQEWVSAGTVYENGITVDSTLCAAYRNLHSGSVSLAVGAEKSYSVLLPTAAFPYGTINEYALVWIGRSDSKSNRSIGY